MAASLGRHFPRIVGCCVALFIAFGGSAYAKHPFGKNTINSRDVIDDIAEERRHQNKSIASIDIKNSLDGSLPGPALRRRD